MKIRVISCSRETYWYADKLGQTFEVLSYNAEEDMYLMQINEGRRGNVKGCDCVVVDDEEQIGPKTMRLINTITELLEMYRDNIETSSERVHANKLRSEIEQLKKELNLQ